MDKWRTMRALETEFYETYGSPHEYNNAFTEMVMERLMCPTFRDAEMAVFNYYRADT